MIGRQASQTPGLPNDYSSNLLSDGQSPAFQYLAEAD